MQIGKVQSAHDKEAHFEDVKPSLLSLLYKQIQFALIALVVSCDKVNSENILPKCGKSFTVNCGQTFGRDPKFKFFLNPIIMAILNCHLIDTFNGSL